MPDKSPRRPLCFSGASYYLWRPKDLGAKNAQLKNLLAEQIFENDVITDALRRKYLTAPAKRELVRQMISRGLSGRPALHAVRMSAIAFRHVPAPDRNVELLQRIVVLAQQHKRYGVGIMYFRLRQEAC